MTSRKSAENAKKINQDVINARAIVFDAERANRGISNLLVNMNNPPTLSDHDCHVLSYVTTLSYRQAHYFFAKDGEFHAWKKAQDSGSGINAVELQSELMKSIATQNNILYPWKIIVAAREFIFAMIDNYLFRKKS